MTRPTKQSETLKLLKKPRGLNRFDAAKYGDSTLNSTVSTLRAKGFLILGNWESVKNRFGGETRVKRYHYIGLI